MSERLEARAEVVKLGRVLAVEPESLAYLDSVPSDQLRSFREQTTNQLFDSSAGMLGRVGAAAKLLPSGLIATIAEKSFGPLLCARAAGAVDADKAIDVAKRLPPAFLADVTVEIDPRRVADIIANVPEDVVVPVAEEMGRRQEHVTMGRFLAFVPDHAIAAAIGVLDDETMLRTAFVLEHKDRLDHAVGLLPPERMPGILRLASQLQLWPEALDMLDHLSEERRGPIADVAAELEDEVVAELVRAVHEAGIWDSLLPVVRSMGEEARVALAAKPAFHDPDVMADIIRAAAEQGLWIELVPLMDALPQDVRMTVIGIAARLDPRLLSNMLREASEAPHTLAGILDLVAEQDPDEVGALVRVVAEAHLWDGLLPIVGSMSETSRVTLAGMPAFHDDAVIRDIVGAAAAKGLWVELVPLWDGLLPTDVAAKLPGIAAELEPDLLAGVLRDAARAPHTLRSLLAIVSDMPPDGRGRVVEVIERADEQAARDLLASLDDPDEISALVALLPDDLLAAIRVAAERHGLTAELDAALAAAG